ncbi:MAG: nucleotidyltransferase domain-containing protein [bacterium]|nr:nucleotidyltransferase domain-containing protein [bacterium]
MDAWLQELLRAVKRGLERRYGDRLQGLYLFGSHARGESETDSDVDLLIVLDDVPDYVAEVRRVGKLISPLALRYEISISSVFLSKSDWLEADGPFYANVRRDAIAA